MFKKIFWLLISILCTCFIFYNSSQIGTVSHNRSYGIVNKLIDVLKGEESLGKDSEVIRKFTNSQKSNSTISAYNIKYSYKIENKIGIKDKILNKIRNISYIKKLTRSELDHIIRKLAHMFEFGLLGLSLCFLFNSFNLGKHNIVIYALFILLFIAVVDETIQRDVVGRESSTIDVLIDFAGGVISSVIFTVGKSLSTIKKGDVAK